MMITVALMMVLPIADDPSPVRKAPAIAQVEGGRLYGVPADGPTPELWVQGPDDPKPRRYRLPVDPGPDGAARVQVRGGAAWAVSRPAIAPGQRLAHLLRIAPEVLPDFAVPDGDGAPPPGAPIPARDDAGPIADRPLEVGRVDPLARAWQQAEIAGRPSPSYDILPVAGDRCLLFLLVGQDLEVKEYQFRYKEDLHDYQGAWRDVSKSRASWAGPFRVLPGRGRSYLILTASGSLLRLSSDDRGSLRSETLWDDRRRPIRLAVSRAEDRATLFFGRGFRVRLDPDVRVEEDDTIPETVASGGATWDVLRACARRFAGQP